MLNRNYMLAVIFLAAFMVMRSQDGSVETFNAIRLEHSSDPGQTITLSAPTGLVGYTLEYPATAAPIDRRYSLSLNGATGSMTWYATPLGTAGQVPYFESDEELTGSPNLLWDQTDQTLTVSSTTNQPMLNLTKTVAPTADDDIISINATYNSTGVPVDVNLFKFNYNGSALVNGSTVNGLNITLAHSASATVDKSKATGLYVNVTGADTNRAVIVSGGFSGFGTENPKTYVDISGDVSFREYNYTAAALPNGGHNCNFDGNGNRFSFLRIGSALTDQVTMSGIAGGQSGKMIKLYNATGQTIKVKNESNSSDAGNRIHTSANADLLLLPGSTYEFLYSAAEQRWLVAFSGPSELAQYGSETVGPVNDEDELPTSIASYLQVSTTTGPNGSAYDLSLENGTTPGQILVIENQGPQDIKFIGTNIELSTRSSTLTSDDAMVLIWSGSQWVQVALAQN